MSLSLDPILSNIIFSLSLIPHLRKPRCGHISAKKIGEAPYVSILVPFYRETRNDVDLTISSLISQTYPKGRMEAILVLEPDDPETALFVRDGAVRMKESGIQASVIESDGKMKIKPHSLNFGILRAKGQFCGFYDAGDIIDKDQIEKAISLMVESEYDVVQSIVLRKGKSFLSLFLFFDTLMWFKKHLPFVLNCAQGMPLSGEGLFIKKCVLEEVGNFPEVITEDAEMGIILSERNKKFALLDSVILERAPRDIWSHMTQKMRWFRGYLSCLAKLSNAKLSMKRKLSLSLLFISPINSILASFGWVFLLLYAIYFIISPENAVLILPTSIQGNIIFMWSMLLLFIGVPLCLISYAQVLIDAKMTGYVPLLVFAPLYWMFVGLCAFCSLFRGTQNWGKTIR